MATTHTVVKGDTLWGIADRYLNDGTKYKQIATLNNIKSPYYIYVGQVLQIDGTGGSSSPSTSNKTATTTSSNKPTIDHFGVMSGDESGKTLFATWTWNKKNTESYKVLWTYSTGNGVWFVGSNSTNSVDKDAPETARQSTYNIPNGAKQVRFKVKPISETYTKNDTETNYWDAEWSAVKTHTVSNPPADPGAPDVEIDKFKLTATLDNLEEGVTKVQFQVVKDNASTVFKNGTATVSSRHASYSCTVDAGSEYKVRCRAYKDSLYSEWSEYSGNEGTIPSVPAGITILRAIDETSVYLEWSAVATAESYDFEYTTKKEYFDGSDQTTTQSTTDTHFTKTGLETGNEYFFRVRATNSDGTSGWSEIKSVAIGTKPSAPTTWSSTTTVIIGEPLVLYWVHNTEDGSSETYAELELTINGVKIEPALTIQKSKDEEEKDKTSSFVVDDAVFESLGIAVKEGCKIEWRVRTAGIITENIGYGDWSIQRTVDIYAPPTLELNVTNQNGDAIDVVSGFPFFIDGLAGPSTQIPIGYHVSIISNESYDTVDNIGNAKTVNVGDEVYSKYFDITDKLVVEMSASNIDLQNNITYTVVCTVSMNSGLTHESSTEFTVDWLDVEYEPNAEIGVDTDTLTAFIMPYCESGALVFHKVNYSDSYEKTDETLDSILDGNLIGEQTSTGEAVFTGITADSKEVLYCTAQEGTALVYYRVDHVETFAVTDDILDPMVGDTVVGARTDNGDLVYTGMTADGTEVYYCTIEERVTIDNVYLAVYRREFDGKFTEIAIGLDGAMRTTVTDPHPALDYARYRIVATTKDTGAVSYYDLPGYPVGGKAVIIQWDEEWSNFETNEESELERPAWSGSLLRLPYNIDVSDSNKSDVSLIEYIGREHPISYYGTQVGQSSSWNVEIDKSDKETVYALRRLAKWMGDVYVREPSGSGYWANISVSFSQKHCEVTIPVTLEIVRVEGGI